MICANITRTAGGALRFGGADVAALTEKYGSPLYIMDESRIRENCRTYKNAMTEAFGPSALPLYASKAASFKQIYRLMMEEGMGVDIVSSGELYTAAAVGFPMEKAYFHSNNKTDADIAYGMDCGMGHFVVDNVEELDAIDRIAGERNLVQPVLLRLTPGIDPHTYAAVSTGQVDSKFGSAIETGQAEEITRHALSCAHLRLDGFHCHVGSQVFDSDVYLRAADIMLHFVADMKDKLGFVTAELDLGGGYGVRYTESDPVIDIGANIHQVAQAVKALCADLQLDVPAIRMEPGRSIVADAGLTVYTVGTVKRIPGYKNYVSVDGGMTDNPRFALYGSRYTVVPVSRTLPENVMHCSVVGRCCESGDIIQENVELPADIRRGEKIAVLTTGAYNYAMSSNYNRVPRLPIVMVNAQGDYLAVRRETPADVAQYDV
jgi:diaminopimelate decarboxylase